MEKYEYVEDIASGWYGVARLMRNKETEELVAMKCIKRGPQIDESVASEITNHRSLRHPNIIGFKEVVLTPRHLAIVMEYAAGGDLFDRLCNVGRFSEDEQICHGDLKLDNTLLDGSPAPRLKICDFGHSQSSLLHSSPESTVGTPAHIAPNVRSEREYDGKSADVWSCGVTLYFMLVGELPFENKEDPQNFMQTATAAQYNIPDYVDMPQDCRHLLALIFVADPSRRITIEGIKSHPWFLKNLPHELTEAAQALYYGRENATDSLQSVEDIMKIVEEAKTRPPVSPSIGGFEWEEEEEEEKEEEVETEEEEEEDEYDR